MATLSGLGESERMFRKDVHRVRMASAGRSAELVSYEPLRLARSMTTAIVVGSGPNGLAAAVTLAQHGVGVTVLEAADTIGGGVRTSENTIQGLLHDDCAAVVPIALASPFFRSLDLESHGLEWGWPTVDLAHPLDGGRAGVMVRSIGSSSVCSGSTVHDGVGSSARWPKDSTNLSVISFAPSSIYRSIHCEWRVLGRQ